jgi:hypothetical protein
MAVQHDQNRMLEDSDKKNKKKMKTSDDRMLLPGRKEGLPYSTVNPDSTDVRPACGDYRLRSDCVHTIRCNDKSITTQSVYPDFVGKHRQTKYVPLLK